MLLAHGQRAPGIGDTTCLLGVKKRKPRKHGADSQSFNLSDAMFVVPVAKQGPTFRQQDGCAPFITAFGSATVDRSRLTMRSRCARLTIALVGRRVFQVVIRGKFGTTNQFSRRLTRPARIFRGTSSTRSAVERFGAPESFLAGEWRGKSGQIHDGWPLTSSPTTFHPSQIGGTAC